MSQTKQAHFQRIYAENFKFIRHVLRKFPTLDSEAEDIIHDVFVRFHSHMATIEPGKERGWLIVSARHAALDRLRQKKNHKTDAVGEHFDEDAQPLWESDAAHELRIGAIARLVDEMIEGEQGGEDFRQFYRDGMSMREIAEKSNVPVGTVAARIYRLREKLRNRIRLQLDNL